MNTEASSTNPTASNISPRAAQGKSDNVLWLDVRTPAEFEEAHIEGSLLHPLSDLDAEQVKSHAREQDACVIICRSGNRARQAAEKLAASGISNLHILEGGIQAWDQEGLPLRRGRKTISLERQVRIGAGVFILTGALLAWFVNPAWVALCGFVGAGLIFAGITDTCGMGMVLARMPWNTRGGCATGSCCSGK